MTSQWLFCWCRSPYHLFTTRLQFGPELYTFLPVLISEVCESCRLWCHPRSHHWMFDCVHDVFAPTITRLANVLLHAGKFPVCYKWALVLPLLKKMGLDRSLPANYRPISSLSTVSNWRNNCDLIYLTSSKNFSTFHSACGEWNSTKISEWWEKGMAVLSCQATFPLHVWPTRTVCYTAFHP